MARLPVPGSDDNVWGTILNDFLTVAHNNDGTLSNTGTMATKAADSAVVHNSGDETIAGIKTFSSSPIVPTPTTNTQAATKAYVDSVASSGAPDATTTTKGIVQLTNDLSGTATAPTVVATHLASALPVNQGGTGSLTQNFVDLTTSQSIGGIKNFTGTLQHGGTAVVDSSRQILAGAGLTGGGDLSADRTLTVSYGTTAGTAAQGNDSRITGAEQTANKGAANGYAPLNSSSKVPTANLPLVFPPVTLTDAATVATDASLGNHFRVTLGGNRTLGNPTNPTDGQKVMWELIQDATGSRTITLDTNFALGTDISSVTLTTTAGKRDFLGAVYNSTAGKWYVIAFVKGY